MNISKMKRSTQIAIMANAGSTTVEKIASGTAPLTLSDSVAGSILEITVNGRSEVSSGSIISVGDNGVTVTTANSDNTLTTSAEFTTALPLRGVSDTVRDKLTCTADSKQVETVCGAVDLGDLAWTYQAGDNPFFYANTPTDSAPTTTTGIDGICDHYTVYTGNWSVFLSLDKVCMVNKDISSAKLICIRDTTYTDATAFKTAVTGVKLIYPLATPITTPLTDAEISAFRDLRIFDPTTSISVTDNPLVTVKYMGKRTTRTATKKRTSRKKKA